jgi:glucokinase
MHYVGVDLGATNLRAAVGDEHGTVNGSARTQTPDGTQPRKTVSDAICDVVKDACQDAGVDPTTVAAASVAAMGRLDFETGTVSVSANFSGDVGPLHLRDPLCALLDTDTVYLSSDTLAGAIGEHEHAHPDVDNLVYLTISSGIGAGVIADGALVGWNGNAGEVGHTTIDHDGFMTCGCGHPGHWEAYCSGENIPRFARALHHRENIDTELPLDADDEFTAKEVFKRADSDPLADRVIEQVATLNTIGVANLVHSYAPQVVVIGGAVALNNPALVVDPIRERLPDAVVTDVPNVTNSRLGEKAVLQGALTVAINGGVDEH